MITCKNVSKSFGDLEVLKGVDLNVSQGEVVVIIGPSGSGKSTFLRCLNHLESIDHGLITLDGEPIGHRSNGSMMIERSKRDVARQRQAIGMVFQGFNLFPHKTALENVALTPAMLKKCSRSESR